MVGRIVAFEADDESLRLVAAEGRRLTVAYATTWPMAFCGGEARAAGCGAVDAVRSI
jgi:hypothetical protein